MKTAWFQKLSIASACLLAVASVATSSADEGAAPCPPHDESCPGYARTGCSHECCLSPIVKWALCCDYYILPPDYGWNAPVKVPVVRRGVTYYRYWPEHWYGQSSPPAGAYRTYPQVYAPNDTTQLGYTYQQVPYWQPAPNRLPPPPVPSQWHVREAHRGYHGRWHSTYTPIHHHQALHHSANWQYWVEPLGATPAPAHAAPQPSGPVGCPPAPEPTPAPKKLEPEPAAPAPTPTPAVPAPPAEGKTASTSKSRLLSLWRKP